MRFLALAKGRSIRPVGRDGLVRCIDVGGKVVEQDTKQLGITLRSNQARGRQTIAPTCGFLRWPILLRRSNLRQRARLLPLNLIQSLQ